MGGAGGGGARAGGGARRAPARGAPARASAPAGRAAGAGGADHALNYLLKTSRKMFILDFGCIPHIFG